MKNQKKTGELKFRDYFGTTAMSVTDGLASTVMTGLVMLYLTDYAGIGQWGAILGSGLLMFARLFDAINDPFEGWLMDRGKITKYGKYRPFIFLSILMTAAGLCGLFSLPSVFADNPVMICVWVIVFYLLYDMGATFYAPNLIYRTLSLDSNDRSKLLIAPRALNMIIGMVGAAIIMIVNGINTALGLNSMHDAFSVAIISMMLISAVLSLLGIALIKERHIPETTKEDKVKVTDIFGMIKTNGALRIRLADMLFTGFIWNFLFATATYYAKWAYCTDLTTGAVDTAKLGTFTMVSSLLMFFPLIIGTLVGSPIMKAIGSPIRFHRILILLEFVPGGILFVLQMVGLLQSLPAVYLLCMGVCACAIGMDYIPGEVINIEAMDYEIYKNGKDRSALCNAANKFLGKAQSAVASGLVGVILVAVGYEVDSATDTFLGELSSIPVMLDWFIVIMGLIPFFLGLVGWLVLKRYPITDEIRADMHEKLSGTSHAAGNT